MPAFRACPGCGQLISGKCPRCQPSGQRFRSPSTRAKRDGTGGYERTRKIVLRLGKDGKPLLGVPRPLCHWCLQVGRRRVATHMDHVVAVANGGGHDIDNAVASCRPCNLSKQDNPNWRPA